MNTGDVLNVEITKLTSTGQGLAKHDGFVIFVENACPNDKLKVKITKVNKNYANAKIEEILTPSESRVLPFCPMQKVCGACQIQYIDYDHQLEFKRQIVQDIMNTIGHLHIDIPKTIPSPQKICYRNKIQYPIGQTKNSKRILAGYYKASSHEIVNIKYCPIQPRICDDIIDFIRNKARECNIEGYCEKTSTGLLRHVVIRHSNKNKECLVCLVVNSQIADKNLTKFAKDLYEKFDEISGVCINFNKKKTNVILGSKTICLYGNSYIKEEICGKKFLIGADTFFQVNPESAENIYNYVKDFIKLNYKSTTVLDAYAGISAIGICLSDVSKQVVSIEENDKAVNLAKKTANENGISNIEINSGDAGKFLKNEKRKFDIIVLDPPRKGCTQESLNYAMKLCKGHIIYVSCNPATLARDLNYLKVNGGEIISIQPFDMFCHTYHIENVAIIKI